MKLEEFQECMDYAPCEIGEFVGMALEVEDCPELVQAAKDFEYAEERFTFMLGKYGVTIG